MNTTSKTTLLTRIVVLPTYFFHRSRRSREPESVPDDEPEGRREPDRFCGFGCREPDCCAGPDSCESDAPEPG